MICDAHSFEVRSRREGRWTVVVVRGEIDLATAGDLREELERLIRAGCRELQVDLAQVAFLDVAGLHVLTDARDRLSAIGGVLSVGPESPPVSRLLRVTGMSALSRPADGPGRPRQ